MVDENIARMLSELGKQADHEKTNKNQVPRKEQMLAITKDTGMFLNILCRAINAKNVLEVGTSVGFSTIWLADAIKGSQGQITTIEQDVSKIKRATQNFKRAHVSDYIQVRHGDALAIINELTTEVSNNNKPQFDLIFLDADKERLEEYFDLLLPTTKINGLIVTDNILYPEKFRPLMEKYTKHIRSKMNVHTVTVPIGNGEEVTLKTA